MNLGLSLKGDHPLSCSCHKTVPGNGISGAGVSFMSVDTEEAKMRVWPYSRLLA